MVFILHRQMLVDRLAKCGGPKMPVHRDDDDCRIRSKEDIYLAWPALIALHKLRSMAVSVYK